MISYDLYKVAQFGQDYSADKDGFADISFPLRTFPGFDNLRSDPEFKVIVSQSH